MPPRRKPTSTRQKKADQQLKRAVKRGDAPPPQVEKKSNHRRRPRIGPTGQHIGSSDSTAIESARKLQSAFIKLPPNFLEHTKQLASNLTLLRPIPDEKAIFHSFDHGKDESVSDALACPKRPKWRFDMTKLEVERNEEGVFRKYIVQTDQALEQWQNKTSLTDPTESLAMPQSPSYYERNLEVWRQLWRVTEISQIILVLLDSRCPILHYPPSLYNHLADRKVILVLTKVDISGPFRVQSWISYINKHYPNSRIVQVESYIEKEATGDHQGRKQYEPSIPDHFRLKLVEVMKEVHAELLEPSEKVKSNPNWIKHWIPPVKREIDWEGVMQAKGAKVGLAVGGAVAPRPTSPVDHDSQQENSSHQEPSYLTIGLIGQPNVGKSSLLNALFGSQKVRASKTPGKTKHFQTLYWTPDVRLVDCPGLVMPNYVPMEMQVLSGILPISRVSAVPACIHYASQFLPLERIYNLAHPSTKLTPVEDKRTWREDRKAEESKLRDSDTPTWTAMDILTSYADAKGWVTAKAGRPDVHRAGNAILRSLAEGRISWGFWPPDTSPEEVKAKGGGNQGVWIPRDDYTDYESDPESEEGEENSHRSTAAEDQEYEDGAEISEEEEGISVGVGMFGALANDDEGNVEESESEDSN